MALRAASRKTVETSIVTIGAALAGLAGVLAGCMQQRPVPPAQTPLPAPLASGGGFFFSHDKDEGAKLVYGRAGSDDVWLMLLCRPGTHDIEITDARHASVKRGQMLVLESGQVQSPLPVKVEQNGVVADGALAIAHAPTSLPALDAFRHTGAISVKLGAEQYRLAASAREKLQVSRFFTACERR